MSASKGGRFIYYFEAVVAKSWLFLFEEVCLFFLSNEYKRFGFDSHSAGDKKKLIINIDYFLGVIIRTFFE